MTSWLRLWLAAVVVVGLLLPAGVAWSGPAMPDPRQMSGIPRPDPQIPAGTVTVRVLDGGFDKPVIGATVTLELRGPGGDTDTREAQTEGPKGRATFTGLDAFVGGSGIAKVTVGDEALQSQPIRLLDTSGTALMLVGGGSGGPSAGAAPAHGQPGGPAIPPPGTAFPLESTPAGQLTVGTFDLKQRKAIPNVGVTLTITPPQGEPIVREQTTDDNGKAVFDELLPPAIPADSKLEVEATLVEGGELRRSKPFEMDPGQGMAVVLAEGAEQWEAEQAAQAQAQAQQAPQARPQLPGPRIVPSLPQSTVRVRIVDANDAPVPGQNVVVVQKTAEGTGGTWSARTDAQGIAQITDVGVRTDAAYFVEARYDGGPYQSPFFGMDKRGGIAVDLRVFEVTDDPSVVRSGVRIFVAGRENDLAEVAHKYEVMVTGDKAFWPGESFAITAMDGAKGFTVFPAAEQWLQHEEKADFAKLAVPLPPGAFAELSFGYLVEHRGRVDFQWQAPFELVETAVVVEQEQQLDAPGARPETETQIPDKASYLLGPRARGAAVEFTVQGLPKTDATYRWIGGVVATVIALATILLIVLQPRKSTAEHLRTRRDELLAHLQRLEREGASQERKASVIAGLDRVYRQLRALGALQRDERRPKRSDEARSEPE